MTLAADFRHDLEAIGLKTVSYKYNLSKDELFHEAIAHDKGRTKKGGPSNEQKAFATKLASRVR
jgi:phosphoenolpyruvate carboxykinase (ATP)